MTIKLPDAVVKQIERLAARESITVEQFLASAAAEKAASWETEEYIRERGKRADSKRLAKALEKVPASEATEEWDRIS